MRDFSGHWPGVRHIKPKAKGATGANGLDNTYSLTRWKKTRRPGELYSIWRRRKKYEKGESK